MLVALVVVACSGPQPFEFRADWTELAQPDPTATELALFVSLGSSSCNSFARFDVIETMSEVVVIAVGRNNGDEFCTADNNGETHSVVLEAPLNDRMLRGCLAPEPGGSIDQPVGGARCRTDLR